MPGKRHADQALVVFAANGPLRSALDRARKMQGQDRSTFIRAAVVRELRARGIEASDEWVPSPDRTGPRSARYPAATASALALNEPISSAKVQAARKRVAYKIRRRNKPDAG
jgi:hypothetical protein